MDSDKIKTGLEKCSKWVTDAAGNRRKACWECPYRTPDDPAGMLCGETLMADARNYIEELEGRNEDLYFSAEA